MGSITKDSSRLCRRVEELILDISRDKAECLLWPTVCTCRCPLKKEQLFQGNHSHLFASISRKRNPYLP